jgi:uncharacterized protein (TIGR02271 family)
MSSNYLSGSITRGRQHLHSETRTDGFMEVEDRFAGYTVYDHSDQKIGKVDDLFVDGDEHPEYIGVKMGFLGTRSTLVPFQMATVDDERQAIVVSTDKDTAQNGPTFDDDMEITPEFENEVYSYYGLQQGDSAEDRGAYADYSSSDPGAVGPGMREGDTETGEFRGHSEGDEGVAQTGSDLEDEDELRVQRSEEELAAGTREREAGQLKVRKRVRTDRETIEVPTRHEEVSVERVPASGEATEAQIGEDEVVVPVTEEEVVVGKRAVAKEEVRIRKDVVSDTEVVEEDVRREEIEVEDDTSYRRAR